MSSSFARNVTFVVPPLSSNHESDDTTNGDTDALILLIQATQPMAGTE
eukprot:CAMPEP_0202471600 /NCGR_PEP_ID=MMETSP1360-20130828/85249_1 /ASSEMBLY_ACC=CAM_ASM_000848 /TAXON_ID=515479 /ORGANISM="Licmophora paradoxa, Strain CCMP2313" /LENGTH=47 /DNA_ID= /DNA_START= /DNA_END= /DNA_ORIENTATION=